MLRFIVFTVLFSFIPFSAHAGMTVIRDAEIEQVLKSFSAPVLQEAGISSGSVRFVLVRNDALNAFVAGGQNIFLNTGLLLKAENAEEVIGVIAHETGHIALGHLFRLRETVGQFTFQSLLSTLIGVAVAVGTGNSEAGIAAQTAGTSMAMRSALHHTRTHEASADEAGVRFLKGAGFPIFGLKSFMEKLADQELLPSSQQSEYVRTHPLTQDRIDYLSFAQSKSSTGALPALWTERFKRVQSKLRGFLYPDQALLQKGDDVSTRYGHAIAWHRKGRTAKSLAMIENLLKQEPRNPWLYELKGQVLFESGKVKESLPAYASAVKLAPSSGLVRAAYGHALLEAKELKLAIKQLSRSLDREPKQPSTHHFLAIAYGKDGREGLSRLHLAEEYVMINKLDFARREAHLALATLPKNAPSRLRVQDILDIIDRKLARKSK